MDLLLAQNEMYKLIPILLLASLACGAVAELPTQTATLRQIEVESTSVVSAEVALNLRDLPEHLGGVVIAEMLNNDTLTILDCYNYQDNGIWAVVEYHKNGENPIHEIGYANKSYISGDCPNK